MAKTVILVGHCGADMSYLKMAIKSADASATITSVESMKALSLALDQGAGLVLVNRVVDYGFDSEEGIDIIRQAHQTHPAARLMLISNFEESQQSAKLAGAMMGFGKRDIGTPKVKKLLQQALGAEVKV